jgi:hypothetical protein
MIPTRVFKAVGHPTGAPNAVEDQSSPLRRSPASPPPSKNDKALIYLSKMRIQKPPSHAYLDGPAINSLLSQKLRSKPTRFWPISVFSKIYFV